MNDALLNMKYQMDEKCKHQDDKKSDYRARVNESLIKDQQYREIQTKLRNEKHQFQEDYAGFLKVQMANKNKDAITSIQSIKTHEAVDKFEKSPRPMIPGLYNLATVGTRPIYHTGVMITNSLNLGSAPHVQQESHKVLNNKYNPITNPIPTMTSNPYFLREMQKYK